MALTAAQHASRRERFPDGALQLELSKLRCGMMPSRLIEKLCKGSERDEQWGKDLVHAIEHGVLSTGEIRDGRVRHIDSEEGRALLETMLLLLGLMCRGKGSRSDELRIDGPAGFWGRTELGSKLMSPGRPPRMLNPEQDPSAADTDPPVVEVEDVFAAALQEERDAYARLHAAEEEGSTSDKRGNGPSKPSRPYNSRAKRNRPHCPGRQAGGLAGRLRVSTRTIGNRARFLRNARFIGCSQPDRDHDDAYLSRRQGDYAYGIWRVLRKLPSKIMWRLQMFWGELELRKEGAGRSKLARLLEAADLAARGGRRPSARGSSRPAGKPPPTELERERQRGQRAAHEMAPGRF
ncbi:MAG TPA: hypothetical protein VFX59_05880 [Polyangiales bacterium]|nr:hypothetical protein [Polyangiales bacterium]